MAEKAVHGWFSSAHITWNLSASCYHIPLNISFALQFQQLQQVLGSVLGRLSDHLAGPIVCMHCTNQQRPTNLYVELDTVKCKYRRSKLVKRIYEHEREREIRCRLCQETHSVLTRAQIFLLYLVPPRGENSAILLACMFKCGDGFFLTVNNCLNLITELVMRRYHCSFVGDCTLCPLLHQLVQFCLKITIGRCSMHFGSISAGPTDWDIKQRGGHTFDGIAGLPFSGATANRRYIDTKLLYACLLYAMTRLMIIFTTVLAAMI